MADRRGQMIPHVKEQLTMMEMLMALTLNYFDPQVGNIFKMLSMDFNRIPFILQ